MRRLPQHLPSFGLLSFPHWASRRWQTSSAVATANDASHQEDTTSQPQLQGGIGALPPGPSAVEHVGYYHVLRPSLIPEASQQLHNAFYTPKQGGRPQQQGEEDSGVQPQLPRKGGCKGLQLEMKVAGVFSVDPLSAGADSQGAATKESHSSEENLQGPAVMWRDCMRRLHNELAITKEKLRILLEGPAGSGKSIALATMVERCRAANWLVLYVPSATALTSGGYFVPRASAATPPGAQAPPSSPNSPTSATPASGRKAASYDTILSAQHILLGMQQAHGVQLAGLPLQLRQSRELLRQAGWTLPSSQGVGQASSSSSSSSSGDSNEGEQGAGEAASSRKEGSAGEVHEVREAGEAGEAYKAYAAGQAGEAHEAGAASGGDAGETEHSSEAAAVAAPEAVGAGKTDAPSSVTSSSSKGSSTERGTLLDLVTAGLSTDMNAALAVDACLALVSELDAIAERKTAKVLFAIDDYNALGHNAPTGYGAWEGADPELGGAGAAAQEGRLVRRQLRVSELTLARALRLLGCSSRVNHAAVLCATSSTAAPPMHKPQPEVLIKQGIRRDQWPRFHKGEVLRALHHYYGQGALTKQPSLQQADRVLALTNGNAAEIRLMLPGYSLLAGRRLYPVRYIPEPRSPSQPSSLA
mmetsp:Transcript_1626/g.3607  ORF Transcript_1626/g.3607 Transcript_1626/m.3607 type:complete len:643 (-) Transcript_1626:351-2279(-)|eukprot:CAMPEP_0202401936 /NCGR_PEP_ID=MMETSP1128-20130828/3843_1 /ASSEMBLY_ACC=CAM_ASM_000463 /TAXON_ID=3047 /ORGANISM="Dunaliella tertiolecta, Strain CCMP1320" /LENGTH=642 /DNA_ID=CAMNT_0049005845 /DNA_START=37 /DNA_END=1965 /DNA_ORIENTATION=+